MTRSTTTLSLLALLLLPVGCSSRRVVLQPRGATVTAVSSEGVDFDLQLAARNPSNRELRGDALSAKVSLGEKGELGSATIPSGQTIPPHGQSVLQVPVSVPWNDVTLFFDLGAAARDVPFKMEGKLAVVGGPRPTVLPFEVTGVVSGEKLKRAMQRFTMHMVE
jgi:hypothetical protein